MVLPGPSIPGGPPGLPTPIPGGVAASAYTVTYLGYRLSQQWNQEVDSGSSIAWKVGVFTFLLEQSLIYSLISHHEGYSSGEI